MLFGGDDPSNFWRKSSDDFDSNGWIDNADFAYDTLLFGGDDPSNFWRKSSDDLNSNGNIDNADNATNLNGVPSTGYFDVSTYDGDSSGFIDYSDQALYALDSAALEGNSVAEIQQANVITLSAASSATFAAGDVVTIDSSGDAYPVSATHLLSSGYPALGITQAASGPSLPFKLVTYGLSTVHSGLTPGSIYYVQDNGTISTTASTVPLGPALNATTILVNWRAN